MQEAYVETFTYAEPIYPPTVIHLYTFTSQSISNTRKTNVGSLKRKPQFINPKCRQLILSTMHTGNTPPFFSYRNFRNFINGKCKVKLQRFS